MRMSSRYGDGCGHFESEFAAVAQQCPERVDEATGRGQECLGMDESFAAFAAIELPGWPRGTDGRQCGQVGYSAQSAVVAFRSVQVSRDAAGIAWHRYQSGVGGQASCGGKRVEVTAGDYQELGARARSESRQGLDDPRVGVGAEAFGDGFVDVFDFTVEVGQLCAPAA